MAFLDVMSCGFGAVVLIFLIINHATEENAKVVNRDQLAEVRLLDYQVQTGEKDLFEWKERLETLAQRLSASQHQLVSVECRSEPVPRGAGRTECGFLRGAHLLGEAQQRRRVPRGGGATAAPNGEGQRRRQGAGLRRGGGPAVSHGLKVGGRNILIAIDVSASMLDETIVNVLRRRNMPEERRRNAPKWRRAVRTAEWLAAQLPLDADFQLFAFNEETRSLVPDSEDQWAPLGDGRALSAAIDRLSAMLPTGGTSLERLAAKLSTLNPLPDNVYLVTDSLPTQGARKPRRATISGTDRLNLFREALRQLPPQVPINVILMPMEGDPLASRRLLEPSPHQWRRLHGALQGLALVERLP